MKRFMFAAQESLVNCLVQELSTEWQIWWVLYDLYARKTYVCLCHSHLLLVMQATVSHVAEFPFGMNIEKAFVLVCVWLDLRMQIMANLAACSILRFNYVSMTFQTECFSSFFFWSYTYNFCLILTFVQTAINVYLHIFFFTTLCSGVCTLKRLWQ